MSWWLRPKICSRLPLRKKPSVVNVASRKPVLCVAVCLTPVPVIVARAV